MTLDGWDVDRYILTDIEKAEWMQIAREVQSRVTDEVIENAVRRMPSEYYALRGSEITSTLKARRDQLTSIAESYYRLRSTQADVYATAASEHVVIERLDGGDVRVQIATLDAASDQPYYQRTFKKDETKEIRIYLQGGNDRVETRGRQRGGIDVRVIGAPGNDAVTDSAGQRVITKPLVIPGREDEVPLVPPRDWGRFTKPLFVLGFHTAITGARTRGCMVPFTCAPPALINCVTTDQATRLPKAPGMRPPKSRTRSLRFFRRSRLRMELKAPSSSGLS
jgi:hypothetical protein